jgi:hypothetical protein
MSATEVVDESYGEAPCQLMGAEVKWQTDRKQCEDPACCWGANDQNKSQLLHNAQRYKNMKIPQTPSKFDDMYEQLEAKGKRQGMECVTSRPLLVQL